MPAATLLQTGTGQDLRHGQQASPQATGHLQATISYTQKTAEPLRIYVGSTKPEGEPVSNRRPDPQVVTVQNLRQAGRDFTLKDNGFQLVRFQVPASVDWASKESVESVYYPALEALLKQHTGASRAHVFDYTLRLGKISAGAEATTQRNKLSADGKREPVGIAHVDYTEKSGPGRLVELLPEEAEQLQQKPYAVVQIWRPLKGPVQDSPLGMVDASTVQPEDLMENSIIFEGRTGHTSMLAYNHAHKWYYTKGMTTEEAYLFVCYDSRKSAKARFTPHTGFRDPTVPEDAPPRESVESRAFVFYD